MTRHLVTSALPYANGPIHFGHLIGAYLPADVYVRTLRMLGEEALFVCGADEHGVAITLGAEAAGTPPAEYAAGWREGAKRTFDAFGIDFDQWSGTSVSPRHTEFVQSFFRRLVANGYFFERESEQLYSESGGRFLADRYVTGRCPNCQFDEARGDECPRCGSWLDALDLGDPRSKLDGSPLVKRSTKHWFLDLPKLREDHLAKWIGSQPWKTNVKAFLEGLLKDVPARAMTRDMAWGIPLPEDVAPDSDGKVLYVWFDAPIGYLSITAEWCAANGNPEGWRDWWCSPDTELVHFIGKDNIPFHCLIFPAMLWGQKDGYVLPSAVPAMEFYNLEGNKFSTSGGNCIDLERFEDQFDTETARFHMLASAPETADSDWTWEGFQSTVNAGLADTIGNLATRVLRFSAKHFDGQLPKLHPDHEAELDALMLSELGEIGDPAVHVLEFHFRKATEQLLSNAAVANRFIDQTAPWGLRKTDIERCASVLRTASEWIALIARWMVPFMPTKAQRLWQMVGGRGDVTAAGWPGVPQAGAWRCLEEGPLGEIEGLFPKIDDAVVQAERERLKSAGA